MTLFLERVAWARVNSQTRREVRNREVYCPPISLFRWWARRPHALIGALLEAARLGRNDIVSDPFSGGGTVALEAAARGYTVYAQDLNPWATWGLRTALDGVDPRELEAGIEKFWRAVEQADVSRAYRSTCPIHGRSEVTHTFWVRDCKCPHCSQRTYQFPYSMITLASRAQDEKRAYYGCKRCGHVTRMRIGASTRCGGCGARFAGDRTALFADRIVHCAHCRKEIPGDIAWSRPPHWTPVLVRRACTEHCGQAVFHFDTAVGSRVKPAPRHDIPPPLRARIPTGEETSVLLRTGFTAWHELYPDRQLRVLTEASALIEALAVPEKVRNRLQLAVAGAGEMAGYLCRWDRFHPKAFEALANHRYSTLGLSVETNPLSQQGRGTIRRRLAASLSAAKWAQRELRSTSLAAATVVTGSSGTQSLADRSVRLIVTDPPYFDAVQYGELAGLFLAWAQVATGSAKRWKVDLSDEAVPNATRRSGADEYERLLGRIFKETARTLKEDGRVLLTYHSTNFRGWIALGRALAEANLVILALGVGHSENEKDYAKRGRRAFTRDLVLECGLTRTGKGRRAPHIVTVPRSSDQRELLAAGIALAEYAAVGAQGMAASFVAKTRRLRIRRIEVPMSLLGGTMHGQEGLGG